MTRKKKLSFPEQRDRTRDLCHQLLQICSMKLESVSGISSVKSMITIVMELCNLQKGICLINKLSCHPEERLSYLNKLQRRFQSYFLKSVSISQCGHSGFGLNALERIKEDNCILKIPFSSVFCCESLTKPLPNFLTKDPLVSGMENVALALVLLCELAIGEQSHWYEYIYSLPSTYQTVAYFTEHHQMTILDGFPVLEMIVDSYRNICRQYAYLFLLLDGRKSTVISSDQLDFLCFDDYRWAVSTVMSRNNRLPKPSNSEQQYLCLVPFWDMMNHRSGRVSTDCDLIDGTVNFYAYEDYEAGDEIFMDYGHRTSSEFLLYSGFVPISNPHHRVPITFNLSKYDTLGSVRTVLLNRLGLKSEIKVLASLQQDSFPPSDLACFARVFVMNKDELLEHMECVENSDNSANSNSLMSPIFKNNRIDTEACKFLQGRLTIIVRSLSARLERNLTKVPSNKKDNDVVDELDFQKEQCIRLCNHDIQVLEGCLRILQTA